MFRILRFASLGLVSMAFACSSSDDDDDNGTNNGGASASGTSTGSTTNDGDWTNVTDRTSTTGTVTDGTGTAADGTASGSSTGTATSGTGPTDAGVVDDFDVNANVGDACTQVRSDAVPSPAILQFVIDKSTSMNDDEAPSTNGATKWEATVQALVNSYATMNPSLAVGESFFPNAQGGCVDQSGGVPIAPLTPDQVAALQAGVQAVPNPTDIVGTPTHDAWREGMRRLQETLANPSPGYETATGYVVLMTDGMPVKTLGCGESDGDNIAVTEAQFNELIDDVAATTASTGIQTFVIGVPGSEQTDQVPSGDGPGGLDYLPRVKLSELAVAGLTARSGCSNDGPYYCHLDMVEEPDFVTALEAVIGTVLASVMSCEFIVPTPDIPNVFVDPDQVNVNYYANGSTTPTSLVRSYDGCATGAWQYSTDQTQLILCDATCATVQADPGARIEADFGCVVPL